MKKVIARTIVGLGLLAMSTGVALSADAGARDTKPAGWPAQYTWHKYEATAPQPVWKGVIKTFAHQTLGDGMRFDTLPLQHAIVRVRGNGRHKIAIFVDPLCPYSRQHERDLNKLNNVTIYTFVVPLLNKSPSSKNAQMAERILCEPSNQARAQTYEQWIVGGISPPQVTGCTTAMREVLQALKSAKTQDGQAYDSLSPITVFEGLNASTQGSLSTDLVQRILALKE